MLRIDYEIPVFRFPVFVIPEDFKVVNPAAPDAVICNIHECAFLESRATDCRLCGLVKMAFFFHFLSTTKNQ